MRNKVFLLIVAILLIVSGGLISSNSDARQLRPVEKKALIDEFINAAFSDEIWYFVPEYKREPFKYEPENTEHNELVQKYNLPLPNRLSRWEKDTVKVGFHYPIDDEKRHLVIPENWDRKTVPTEYTSTTENGEAAVKGYINRSKENYIQISSKTSKQFTLTNVWNDVLGISEINLESESDIIIYRGPIGLSSNGYFPSRSVATRSRASYYPSSGGTWIDSDHSIVKSIFCGPILRCLGFVGGGPFTNVETPKQLTLIKILYNENLRSGMTKSEVRDVLMKKMDTILEENQ